ncbi:protein phosphatase 1 regulatory subunit 1B-like isoform X2 [Cottoperca gobio]|uniref:Protein phosphatase 1 regulatory subunit 1B n=1 Tax=Cottoperca gobio TaxID=56716 RepID=A0A6J2RPL4_COTGO|nr:protein phosphatase 1 regulatory subunit 1B-like isoform X2 [Cottoperca gobio]
MDPLPPADTELMERDADKDARRKIQFSVPSSVPTQLDPRQVEMWVLGENGALKAKLVHTSSYQPPSLKAVQRMALAHLASIDMSSVEKDESSSGEEEEDRKKESQQTPSATDLREESQPLRHQSAPQGEEEAKGRGEGKGE